MIKAFSDEAWEDYTYWETQDKKTLKRIFFTDTFFEFFITVSPLHLRHFCLCLIFVLSSIWFLFRFLQAGFYGFLFDESSSGFLSLSSTFTINNNRYLRSGAVFLKKFLFFIFAEKGQHTGYLFRFFIYFWLLQHMRKRPQNADEDKRKEPQEEGLWPLLLRFLSFEISLP